MDYAKLIDPRAFYGIAAASAAGLLLGAVMQPTLRVSDGPEGPQSLGPVSAPRNYASDDRAAFASYRYGIPDYVIGADWLRPEQPAFVEFQPEAATETAVAAWEPDAVYTPAAYVESEPDPAPEPAPEPRYPSMGGDVLAGVGVPPPPEPPEPAAEPHPAEAYPPA